MDSEQDSCVLSTDIQGLELIARGKVRDIYRIPSTEQLLFVATDRISAYDVILKNGIPSKGEILTELSKFWFELLQPICPNHISTSTDIPSSAKHITRRSLIVNSLKILPIESIVRGYITGSAWKEYIVHGTVHGLPQPKGLVESAAFDQPIWTPSTKAELGQHDENISPEKAHEILGEDVARQVESQSLALYSKAAEYAYSRGIILADTKFEFGVDANNRIILADEVLTPDSSRFWAKANYVVGKSQKSYDKQYLRDWLTSNKLNGIDGVAMPLDVITNTRARYIEAYETLTQRRWN